MQRLTRLRGAQSPWQLGRYYSAAQQYTLGAVTGCTVPEQAASAATKHSPASTHHDIHARTSQRGFSSSDRAAPMNEDKFHELADEALESLQSTLEEFVEDANIPGGDVEFGQGVLTAKLGTLGTYVYNKQTPNRQIWLSSPVSGPVRYDYQDGHWVYKRDGREMMEELSQELRFILDPTRMTKDGSS